MTFADSQVVYRDLDGVWGSFRISFGGKDYTYFRDVPAEVGGYQLTEPYSFGPADFRLPQVTMFEVDDLGSGPLRGIYEGSTAVLRQVDADGAVVRTVWRGIITNLGVTTGGITIHCDGEASGRLAMRRKLPDLFSIKHPVGRRIYNAFTACRLTLTPHLGGDYGISTDGRGTSGSMLDYADAMLAATISLDGSQQTVAWRESHRDYHLSAKDTTTINFTAFLGAHGVDPDVSSDLSEQPTTIYGSGVSPDGLVWVNGKYPGLEQGEAPPYPMDDDSAFGVGTTNADTDSGDGVSVMLSKLTGMGYLDRVKEAGGYDGDAADAVKDLQDDAGLPQTGTMTRATWRALFDTDVTGFSLASAFVAPLAQLSEVKKWNLTANGSKAGRNPAFDPKTVEVDLDVDHGPSVEKARARRWSRGVLQRSQNQKNWAGTLTLSSDVHVGDVTFAEAGAAVMSRLDIRPGMNMRLRHFDGNTRFHVSVVNVSSDLSVTLGIDTQGRDAAALAEVIARNIESRSNPARQWLRQRSGNVNSRLVEFSEVGGEVFNKIRLDGDQWNVFPVIAGQAGTAGRIRIQTSDDPAAFVVAVFGKKVSPGWLRSHVGNPFHTNKHGESPWTNPEVQSYLDDERVLLGVWGDDSQPCGYAPRSHQKPDGSGVSDAPITGLFLDDGGFDYHTFSQPVLWVAVYPDRDTVIKPQRVLWETFEALT